MEPQPKYRSGIITTVAVLLSLVAGCGILGFSLKFAFPIEPTVEKPKATTDRSESRQEERRLLIEEFRVKGVIQKIEAPKGRVFVRLWVRPRFYTLDFDSKKAITSLVYAYHFDGTDPAATVMIMDSQSGKEVGQFPNWRRQLEMY